MESNVPLTNLVYWGNNGLSKTYIWQLLPKLCFITANVLLNYFKMGNKSHTMPLHHCIFLLRERSTNIIKVLVNQLQQHYLCLEEHISFKLNKKNKKNCSLNEGMSNNITLPNSIREVKTLERARKRQCPELNDQPKKSMLPFLKRVYNISESSLQKRGWNPTQEQTEFLF